MKWTAAALVLLALPLPSCGDAAGAEGCELYRDEMKDNPEAVASVSVLPLIEDRLDDMDDLTRRAFAALITAAGAGVFDDPTAVDEAAAEVRAVCLSEHSVEIEGPP